MRAGCCRRVSPRLFCQVAKSSGQLSKSNYGYIDPLGLEIPATGNLEILSPTSSRIPFYRVVDLQGRVVEGVDVPEVNGNLLVEIYRKMLMVRVMDTVLYDAQRQGRVSFYMTSSGEEGATVGSASGLNPKDPVFSQYREQGVLMWRGYTLQQFAHQCFSNTRDPGKGRQMPVHYGSKELAFHCVSSPLATQIPHAVGTAYALKLEAAQGISDLCSVAYFGDGAASEGDFHAAMNFASTLEVPCLFVCRNNGFAISTPVEEQFRGDGIVSRAAGYGMAAVRVDGNDAIAVHAATKLARKYVVENKRPLLLELMSYRVGHHSTSDDSTRYRQVTDIEHFRATNCPIKRLRGYLMHEGLWDDKQDEQAAIDMRGQVLQAMKFAEAEAKTPLREMLRDVYSEGETPANLSEQQQQLKKHMSKYRAHYEAVLQSRRIKLNTDLE